MVYLQFERGYALPPEALALLSQERLRACGAQQPVSKLSAHIQIVTQL